jgi:Rnl2 family RNA ligase
MNTFRKFTDIENVTRQKYIDKVIEEGHGNKEFVATEKTHGANCSLYYDGIDFSAGSRSQMITKESNFYGISNHWESLKEKTIKLYQLLGDDGEIVVYGEWFGGRYPNHVSPPGTKQVQRECLYKPENDFYGFGIVKNGEWLNVDERTALFKDAGFYYAKILCRGTFQECLDYPNDFLTTIPKDFGLEDIEGNICEGTVIESVVPLYFANGNKIIFKNKNSKFTEKEQRTPKVKEDVQLSEEGLEVLNNVLEYVNKNRLNAVVSKFELLTDKHFGQLMGAYIVDIIDEYRKDFEKELGEGLEEKEEKKIKKELSKAVQTSIREDFSNIIDKFN